MENLFGATKDEILTAFQAKLKIETGREPEKVIFRYRESDKKIEMIIFITGKNERLESILEDSEGLLLRTMVVRKLKSTTKKENEDYNNLELIEFTFDFFDSTIAYDIMYITKDGTDKLITNKF